MALMNVNFSLLGRCKAQAHNAVQVHAHAQPSWYMAVSNRIKSPAFAFRTAGVSPQLENSAGSPRNSCNTHIRHAHSPQVGMHAHRSKSKYNHAYNHASVEYNGINASEKTQWMPHIFSTVSAEFAETTNLVRGPVRGDLLDKAMALWHNLEAGGTDRQEPKNVMADVPLPPPPSAAVGLFFQN